MCTPYGALIYRTLVVLLVGTLHSGMPNVLRRPLRKYESVFLLIRMLGERSTNIGDVKEEEGEGGGMKENLY